MKLLLNFTGVVATGLFFSNFVSDDFLKYLAVVLPAVISIVTSLFTALSKIRKMLVSEVTEAVLRKYEQSEQEQTRKIEEKLNTYRDKIVAEVVDQVWYRIDLINELKKRATNEEPFDLKELSSPKS